MSATLLHLRWPPNGHTELNLGPLQFLTPRQTVHGMGHEASIDIHFANATIEIPSAALTELVRRGQEALAAQGRSPRWADVSGSTTNIQE